MNAIKSYLATEWKIWILAIFVVIGISAGAGAQARPVMVTNANGMEFHHDKDANKWYARYDGEVTNLGETFDDVRVLWKSKYAGTPVVLVAGQQGPMCEMTMRLYWYRTPIELARYNGFDTCFAQKVTVTMKGNIVTVNLDGKIKTIELK